MSRISDKSRKKAELQVRFWPLKHTALASPWKSSFNSHDECRHRSRNDNLLRTSNEKCVRHFSGWNDIWLAEYSVMWTVFNTAWFSVAWNITRDLAERPCSATPTKITKVLFLILKLKCHAPHNFQIQKVLASKRRTLLSWKVVSRYIFSPSYAWWV